MSKVITVAYTAVVAPTTTTAANICRTFAPNNAAADLSTFDGTYYDTNVAGWGEGMSLEQFIKTSVAHPGLVALLKQAQFSTDHSASVTTDDADFIMYMDEVKGALAPQGFAITVTDANAE